MTEVEKMKHAALIDAVRGNHFTESLYAIFTELVKELPYDFELLYVTDMDMHIDIDIQVRPKTEDQKATFPYDDENNCFSATPQICFDWDFEKAEIYADGAGSYTKNHDEDPVGLISIKDLVSYTCGLDLSEDKTKEINSIFTNMFITSVTGRM